jgi:hypothetical protein
MYRKKRMEIVDGKYIENRCIHDTPGWKTGANEKGKYGSLVCSTLQAYNLFKSRGGALHLLSWDKPRRR